MLVSRSAGCATARYGRLPACRRWRTDHRMMTELQHGSSDRPTDDIVLVHSSDLHVDDDLGIGAYNGLIVLASVLATARSLAADIVLLAGDTFDNHRVSAPVLARATALLATAGVPVVLL